MDGVLAPVIVAVVSTLGGIAATLIAARTLRRMGLGEAQLQVNRTLRELAEAKEQEAAIWKAKYDAEVVAHAQTVADRDRYRRDSDDCDRRLSNVYSELRASGRLVDRRTERRDEGASS